jgi:hypothetical protein
VCFRVAGEMPASRHTTRPSGFVSRPSWSGPRVKDFVCHEFEGEEPWEHTALLRTILLAFADRPLQALDAMANAGTPRVKNRRAHVGYALEDEPRTNIDPPDKAEMDVGVQRRARRDSLPGSSGPP